MVTNAKGDVPLSGPHGFGLYYNDCRFLNGYELKIDGENLAVYASDTDRADAATLDLSITEPQIELRLSRVISGERLTLHDVLTVRNRADETIEFSLSLIFQTHFEDIFAVRGMKQGKRGTLYSPEWTNEELFFRYVGADKVDRTLTAQFSPVPSRAEKAGAHYDFKLPANACQEISVLLHIVEGGGPSCPSISGTRVAAASASLQDRTQVSTDDRLLNRVLNRSLLDLTMLRSSLGNAEYFAAGIPWYAALFGRDSIITALQMLAYNPQIAEQTIRLLARHQGKRIDEWREEEPGKILHELRVGEMAHLNEIPHTPYYGSIDATPLWLILVGRHAAWTGDLRCFNESRPNIEAALRWIDEFGDADRDGYVEYQCKSEGGLVNQGWKDSNGSIVNADGSVAESPIALVEVQAYVYRAKTEMAALFRIAGDHERAAALESEARSLRERFNRDFWSDEGYYVIALGKGKRRAEILSSNAGQVLWCGIADTEKAKTTANALLAPEMFSGWGIRTLATVAVGYNPNGYHLGTIWPHDNSLIAAGFKNYALDTAALRVLNGLVGAAQYFPLGRLPELFAGFARETDRGPAPYPIACQPQAWAAAAIPFMVTTILGLEPDAFQDAIEIVQPNLPEGVDHLEVRNLSVGAANLDLSFERSGGEVLVRTENVRGNLQVIVEP